MTLTKVPVFNFVLVQSLRHEFYGFLANQLTGYIFNVAGVIGGGHFCSERGFSQEVVSMALKLVPCTRRIWQLTKV